MAIATTRTMLLGMNLLSQELAARIALLLGTYWSRMRFYATKSDAKSTDRGTLEFLPTWDIRAEWQGKPLTLTTRNDMLARAAGMHTALLVAEFPGIASVVFKKGPRRDMTNHPEALSEILERAAAVRFAVLASGAWEVTVQPAGINFSGRRMYAATGVFPKGTGFTMARMRLIEATNRMQMTIETVSVVKQFNPDGCGLLTEGSEEGAVRFVNVIFY